MENIFKKENSEGESPEKALEQLKYDLNSTNSDSDLDDDDDSRDAALAIEESMMKDEPMECESNYNVHVSFTDDDIKEEPCDPSENIILPDMSPNFESSNKTSGESPGTAAAAAAAKKEIKSKKELEEEEREKMHDKRQTMGSSIPCASSSNRIKHENFEAVYILEHRNKLSDSCDDDEETKTKAKSSGKRRKKTDKQWKKERVFENKGSALKALNEENVPWRFHYKNRDKEGNVKEIFRCAKVKYRGKQCQAGVHLYYPSQNTDRVVLYRSTLDHDCVTIETQVTAARMAQEAKIEIRKLFERNSAIKPKRIIEILTENNVAVPKLVNINNYLASLRRKKQLGAAV